MVTDLGHDKIVPFAQQGGPHVKTRPHLEAAGLELAQTEATVRVRPAKNGRQVTQAGEQVSARAGGECGDLGGGAARLEDSHRGKPG